MFLYQIVMLFYPFRTVWLIVMCWTGMSTCSAKFFFLNKYAKRHVRILRRKTLHGMQCIVGRSAFFKFCFGGAG